MSLNLIQARNDAALHVHPLLLLEILGEEGCALRYNPGNSDPHEGLETDPCWEVWYVDTVADAVPCGAGESPVAALVDAALNILSFEDDHCIFDTETVDLTILAKAIDTATRFIREARGLPRDPPKHMDEEGGR